MQSPLAPCFDADMSPDSGFIPRCNTAIINKGSPTLSVGGSSTPQKISSLSHFLPNKKTNSSLSHASRGRPNISTGKTTNLEDLKGEEQEVDSPVNRISGELFDLQHLCLNDLKKKSKRAASLPHHSQSRRSGVVEKQSLSSLSLSPLLSRRVLKPKSPPSQFSLSMPEMPSDW